MNNFKSKHSLAINRLGQFADKQALFSHFTAQFPGLLKFESKGIIVVGASPEGERLISLCGSLGIKVLSVCDGNPEKQAKSFAGKFTIEPIDKALAFGKDVPIIVASHKGYLAIKELRELGAECVLPFAVLQIVYPERFEPHMFYRNWIENLFLSCDKYSDLYPTFGDDKSRATLDAILNYRLTFQDKCLLDVLTPNPYMSRDVATFKLDGIYIDGGTFNGDSINHYIQAAEGKYSKILAFEPDPQTFITLKENFKNFPNVIPYQLGLFSHKTTLRFVSDESRAALISDKGNITIDTVSIDEILNGDPVNYIKLNIEGVELAALNGAKNSIRKFRPILAIAAYHSPNHLWEIPKLIQEIEPGYKIYLRQHDYGTVETVIYAVPQQHN